MTAAMSIPLGKMRLINSTLLADIASDVSRR
jgi:hypothetical protein